MKKRTIATILTGVLLVVGLTGCGAAKQTEENEKDLLASIKEAGVIKVGTEGTYAPYTYHDDSGELVGYDVEVAQAVAEKLGVKAEFVETKWDSIIAGLDAKRFDIIVNQVGITPERQQKYNFSIPYTYTKGALIVKESNQDIKSFEDLSGKKSAQSLTSNWAKLAESYGAELVGTDGFNQSIDLVLAGRADATINDNLTFYDYVNQKPDADVKIAALSDESSQNGILIRQGNESLVEAIDAALAELTADGTLKQISEKYFGVDVSVEQ
ncbi:amino acid ABC transporter substrate-binding protein [Clostridium aminobutyricum]|uniref:Amino acid ABC transporter substrate-binding protein n=1 Tax=Clostridium aminobutyricum TaxID=33953 RepID=A0A939IH69_CLOAM|nr:amino acid ABC transporter substrate-binding protein [Clostridium aminobutyricum]MBN7773262.1 amino acid ABC transporter substrate-binding protein [Clostridium aminobutyricum]